MNAIPFSRPDAFPTEVHALADRWWAVLLRGIFAVLFGVLAILVPGLTLAALILLFGAYAVVDGIFDIVSAFRRDSGERWWVLVLEGVVSIGAGIIAWVMPGLTAVVFVVLVGIWAIITGVLEIIAAVRMRAEIKGEWLLALGGVASIVFGGLVLAYPAIGALALMLWIGAYAIVFGVILMALAFRLRGWRDESLPAQARRAA